MVHCLSSDRGSQDRYSKDKLRYFNLYKYESGAEEYVLKNMSRRNRSLLAQFRMGILPLNVETGRFRRQELNERICNICNTGSVECEMHVLCGMLHIYIYIYIYSISVHTAVQGKFAIYW